jgi:nitrite reductase/ring-hydroxylating ferredoxin subunit
MKVKTIFFSIPLSMLLCLLLSACKGDDPISRTNPCAFYFYYEPHPTSLIFSAYRSPGMFVYVWSEVETNGRRHIYVESNDGKSEIEDNIVTTAIEQQSPCIMGVSNQIGLIVGCTNFNGPTAFDRSCPNCLTHVPLTWYESNRQHVVCEKCKRRYDLNTGTLVSGAAGEALMRYIIQFDGRRLHVGN